MQHYRCNSELVMKSLVVSNTLSTESTADSESVYQRSRRRWMVNLLLSSLAATVTGISGLALAGASLIDAISPTGRLSSIGVVLLAITFPILILAAHCL